MSSDGVRRLRAARHLRAVRRDLRAARAQIRALDQLAARNAAILQNAMDGFFVLDADCRFLEVNAAFCRMTGYTADELHRLRMTDLEVAAGTPDGWQTGLHHFTTRHRHHDGHIIRLESCVIVLRDGDRKILVGFARDVTERCRAEEALRRAHDRFEALVGGMPLGYIVWSRDFRVLDWNPTAAAIFGYGADEVLDRPAADLIVPEDARTAFDRFARDLLAGRARAGGEVLACRRKDGRTIRCEWFSAVLPDAGGGPALATLVRDISEREQLEAQLRQSQKLESLGVLAGGVAHDFNNLLVAILANASLALDRLSDLHRAPGVVETRTWLERVIGAAQRATGLTQRMLAYAGRATCEAQVLDFAALVRETAEFVAAGVPKTVRIEVRAAGELPPVKADPGQMQQVVLNLLVNAAEAIGAAGGEVTVTSSAVELDAEGRASSFAERGAAHGALAAPSELLAAARAPDTPLAAARAPDMPLAAARALSSGRLDDHALPPGRYVVLEVRDTGGGIPPEIAGRIFDPFFTTKFAGRGLGLSAILGIVRAHGGAITFHSRVAQPSGTTFRVLLPAAAEAIRPPAEPGAPAELPRGVTLLVIDDEEDVREVVEDVLTAHGVRVLSAASGPDGLRYFRRHAGEVDAVLLDLNMPGMSGEAVFHELRAMDPEVRVILSTGYSEQEAALHLPGARLAGVVHKPYTASGLVAKVAAALAGGGAKAAAPAS